MAELAHQKKYLKTYLLPLYTINFFSCNHTLKTFVRKKVLISLDLLIYTFFLKKAEITKET